MDLALPLRWHPLGPSAYSKGCFVFVFDNIKTDRQRKAAVLGIEAKSLPESGIEDDQCPEAQ